MLKKLLASTFLVFVYSAHAVAAGSGHDSHGADTHGGDAHHASSGGLPQLDPSSYPSQIFWLVIVFVLMYFFFAKKSLPEISNTIEKRSERITNDLDSAERLKEEVASVQKSYEDSLKGAREESSNLFAQMEKDIKEKSEKLAADFQEDATNQIRDLEKSIDKARKNAMEEMSDVAAEVAKDSAEKIIGVEVDLKYAKSIVDSLVDETVKKAAQGRTMELLSDPHHASHIWYTISFVIFAGIIFKFGIPAFNKMLDGRIEQIKKDLEEAENLRVEAQEMLAQYQRKHRDAVKESETIIKNARESARQFKEKAEADLDEMMKRRELQLQDRLERMKQNAISEIQEHAAGLAMNATRHIISEKLDKKAKAKLVDEAIGNIEANIH